MSEVSICNAALSRIGYSAIVTSISPPDHSAEAEQCAIFYPLARDRLLATGRWSFAIRRVLLNRYLAPAEQPVFGWAFSHALPADYLRILGVYDFSNAAHDVWRRRSGETVDVQIPESVFRTISPLAPDYCSIERLATGVMAVLSNHAQVAVRYVARVTNTAQYPPDFRDALSWSLAGDLAGSLIKGNDGMQIAARCMAMAERVTEGAQLSDARQTMADLDFEPPSIAARWM